MKVSTRSPRFNIIANAYKSAVASGNINTANFLTFLRMLFSPAIVLLILYGGRLPYDVPHNLAAGLLFILAALTDKADGCFARRNNTITELGKFLDPLADKILMLPVMGTLAYLGKIPLWVFILVTLRELSVSLLRVIAARKGISFPASWSGKIKMFSQVVVVSTIIIFPEYSNSLTVRILVYVMAAITLYSWVDYALRGKLEVFQKTQRAER